MAGLMVLDTACQRTVCGSEWMKQHVKALQDFRLLPHTVATAEAFQFGRGQPITARSRVYFPSVIGDVHMLLGASVVETQFHFWLQILCWKHWVQSLTLARNKCFSERLESRQTSSSFKGIWQFPFLHLMQIHIVCLFGKLCLRSVSGRILTRRSSFQA